MSLRLLSILIFLLLPAGATVARGEVFTLWPAVDYRHSPATDYTSVHLLGPLIRYERQGEERQVAIRPLYSRSWNPHAEVASGELLYPVGSGKRSAGRTYWQGFQLLSYDFGERDLGSENEFMLFPFIFSGESEEQEKFFAFFPFGGRLLDRFGRDEIRFTLFPLYTQLRRKETVATYYLWPFFGTIRGENERGVRMWPLFGLSSKEGVYRKRFFLWPIFHHDDLAQDTDNPRRRRGAFPFYLSDESADKSSRTVLWPFFHHRVDRDKGIEEWDAPWPLVRISRGGDRDGQRFLPFYADERTQAYRKRWYVWPLYKIEELHTELVDRRRDRVLFFLFSRLEEEKRDSAPAHLARIDLWPLFSYQEKDRVGHFHFLSLLEPFFPHNEPIRRNWAPLWRLYQARWDGEGNSVSTLLWNLYWKERRGDEIAMELFPLFSYRRENAVGTDLRLLKGLLGYSRGPEGSRLRVLFVPFPISGADGGGHPSAEVN